MLQPILIFDLDGTLVDTAPDLIDTLNALFRREGIAPVAFDEARQFIGGGARVLIERGLAAIGRSVSPDEMDTLYAEYVEAYADRIAELSRPFPGLEGAMDVLAARGFCFAVCTNKLERLSVKLLDALDLSRRFAAICGQDTFGIQKPDPRVLEKTIAAAGGILQGAVMVGDSRTDIATARAARVPVIAVDFGYTDTPVRELAPDRVISHFDQLPAAVDDILQAAGLVRYQPGPGENSIVTS